MVSTTYFTQSGSTEIIERDGKVQRAEFKSFEDGKYFNFTKRDADSEWIKGAYTLGGNEVLKSSVDEFRSEFTDLLFNISVGKNVRVENNDSIVIEKKDRTIVYKDINKTSLYVPAEIADYKSSALMEIGYYHIVDGGYGFNGTAGNITLKSYRILSKIGDSPVVAACIYEDAQKIYIPKSVVKIELNGGASSVEIHYDGTVAEWNNNVTIVKIIFPPTRLSNARTATRRSLRRRRANKNYCLKRKTKPRIASGFFIGFGLFLVGALRFEFVKNCRKKFLRFVGSGFCGRDFNGSGCCGGFFCDRDFCGGFRRFGVAVLFRYFLCKLFQSCFFFVAYFARLIDCFHDKEENKRGEKESNNCGNNRAEVQNDRFFYDCACRRVDDGISQDDLKAFAVLSQRNHVDKGLKYTFDKRVYDCGERAADNHTYCKVKDAATIDERLEFLPKFEFVFLFIKCAP